MLVYVIEFLQFAHLF